MSTGNLYINHTSGTKSSRPQWDVVNKVLRAGDALVATRLDRVGRSTAHLVSLLHEFRQRGMAFQFLELGINTTTAEGRMVYRMLTAVAEFQRDLITANTREGVAAAPADARRNSAPPKHATPRQNTTLATGPCSRSPTSTAFPAPLSTATSPGTTELSPTSCTAATQTR